MDTKILSTLPALSKMYICPFGQNPSTGLEYDTQKPYFRRFKSAGVTLKIRSRSQKYNKLFPPYLVEVFLVWTSSTSIWAVMQENLPFRIPSMYSSNQAAQRLDKILKFCMEKFTTILSR